MNISFTKDEIKSIYDALHRYYETVDTNPDNVAIRQVKFHRLINKFVPPHDNVDLDLSRTELGYLKEVLVHLDPPDNDLRIKINNAHQRAI